MFSLLYRRLAEKKDSRPAPAPVPPMATLLHPNVNRCATDKGRLMAVPVLDEARRCKDKTDGKYEAGPRGGEPSSSADRLGSARASLSQVLATVDFRKESERLETLRFWPCNFLSADTAAKNGLFYNGKDDCLVCAFCKVELSHWKEGDDIEADHGRWSPQCPFLLGKAVGNVPASRDECGAMASGAFKPAHSLYRTEASRLATFKFWPPHMKQKPGVLAEAGFYYSGSGDQTICYYCGGGLKDWEEDDDPWEQHAMWFSRCPYLVNVKGEDFVKETNLKFKAPPAPAAAPPLHNGAARTSTQQVDTASCQAQDAQRTRLPAEAGAGAGADEGPAEKKTCRICFEEERNVCFVPCGHVVACIKCAMSVSQCPVCREPYTRLVKLFFS